MEFLTALDISSSGMKVQRKRMEVIADNLANSETTRTPGGGPYRRKMVVMMEKALTDRFEEVLDDKVRGVEIAEVVEDRTPFKKEFNPNHPDADDQGYLMKPNVDLIVETTNMLMARRAFEANLAAIKTTRQMVLRSLEIGR
jgi:flagellar basal-body rod protein FlgC